MAARDVSRQKRVSDCAVARLGVSRGVFGMPADVCEGCGGAGILIGTCICQQGKIFSPCPSCSEKRTSARKLARECQICNNRGLVEGECPYCHGRGELRIVCPECRGTGKKRSQGQRGERAAQERREEQFTEKEHQIIMQILHGIRG